MGKIRAVRGIGEAIDMTPEQLLRYKGKRARRRELEAVRERGHLKAWYKRQQGPYSWLMPTTSTFRQIRRVWRYRDFSRYEEHCDLRAERRVGRERLRAMLTRNDQM